MVDETSQIQQIDNFSYCKCKKCKIVSYNSKNNIWIHQGYGILNHDDFYNIPNGTIHDDIFIQPTKRTDYTSFYEHYRNKPQGVIWFSNGSWLFDPCCGGSNGHYENETEEIDSDKTTAETKVIIIKNPKNILSINTIEELDNFINKYNVQMQTCKKSIYEKCMDYIWNILDYANHKYDNAFLHHIRWDKIYQNGYYGVSFNFRKVEHLYQDIDKYDVFDNKYVWHYGFDVESLCIFDTRAFDNKVLIDVVKI